MEYSNKNLPLRTLAVLTACLCLFWIGTVAAQGQGTAANEQANLIVAENGADFLEDEPVNRDPFEKFNRAMFNFNMKLDKALFRPVAKGYRAVFPDPVEQGVSNFFSNLGDVGSAANNLLQGKINATFSDLSRVLINSTVGLLGLVDVASRNNIPKRDEDLGQTLGVWGFEPGPYVVLPFIGPSSVRDSLGWAGDFVFDPVFYVEDSAVRWGVYGVRYLDRRAAYLTLTDIADQAALDPYIFFRESYFQSREAEVLDGQEDDF